MCQIFPSAANLAAGFLSPAAWELLPGSGTPSPPARRKWATFQDRCAARSCLGREGRREGGVVPAHRRGSGASPRPAAGLLRRHPAGECTCPGERWGLAACSPHWPRRSRKGRRQEHLFLGRRLPEEGKRFSPWSPSLARSGGRKARKNPCCQPGAGNGAGLSCVGSVCGRWVSRPPRDPCVCGKGCTSPVAAGRFGGCFRHTSWDTLPLASTSFLPCTIVFPHGT